MTVEGNSVALQSAMARLTGVRVRLMAFSSDDEYPRETRITPDGAMRDRQV